MGNFHHRDDHADRPVDGSLLRADCVRERCWKCRSSDSCLCMLAIWEGSGWRKSTTGASLHLDRARLWRFSFRFMGLPPLRCPYGCCWHRAII